jgi:hypothetical protein
MSLGYDLRKIERKRAATTKKSKRACRQRKTAANPALGAGYGMSPKKIIGDPYKAVAKLKQRMLPKAKTKAEIAKEIKLLKAMKPFVPKLTFFGDNNHHEIEAEIYVLEHGCDEDEIAKKYLPESGDGEPTEEEREKGETVEVESAARDAMNWRDGDPCQKDPPSKDWMPLAIKGGWKP